ncbi:MAG TPA: glycosyltransferase family 4 protein [Chloroflexota bacterium]|jgi:glycosyltransferase involved in cell wall biosynthesis
MKILMLSWEYPPHNVGGLGKHVFELVPALSRAGVEVQLLTPRWAGGVGEEVVADATMVHRVEPPVVDMPDFFTGAWRTNVAIEEQGKRLLDAGGFDLIHAHDWLVAFAGVALKHAFKVPLLATVHATEFGRSRGIPSGEMPRAIHNVEWWLTYEAWRVIVCSHFMAAEVGMAFHTPVDKVDVVPNGVDTARFDALDGVDLSEFRRRYALDSEKIVFYVGRVVHEKGVHLLVEAMPAILAARPDAKLVVAGTGGSLGTARARAAELALGDKVLFTGFIPDEDRDQLFRVADVACFPSLYEPFGIVALEAMAARVPVVAANVGGLADVVENHETGLTIYPDSVDSLAWGVVQTLDHPDWAAARVENAYRMVRQRYNWGAIAESTLDVYRRVGAERKATTW